MGAVVRSGSVVGGVVWGLVWLRAWVRSSRVKRSGSRCPAWGCGGAWRWGAEAWGAEAWGAGRGVGFGGEQVFEFRVGWGYGW